MTNLAAVLLDARADHPGHAAVRQDDLKLTYSGLAAAAGQVATVLRTERVAAGDRVAVMLPNVAAFPVVAYGVLAAGAVLVR
jgi:long-chain acyl-CoA synthetase